MTRWLLGVLVVGCAGTTADKDVEPTDLTDPTDGTDATDPPAGDVDGDGFEGAADCGEGDALRFPGAPERCNGLDDDCDGQAPHEGEGGAACAACDDLDLWELARTPMTPEEKFTALHDAISVNAECTYSPTTWYMFVMLDKDASGMVECIYTGRQVAVGDDKPPSDDMNTEHTWPQSWGAENGVRECDLNHLFPSDAEANGKRSSYPFDEVVRGQTWTEGGSKLGESVSGALVFEPRDERKGDVARAMLYFWTRYHDIQTAGEHIPSAAEISLWTTWAAADPPDAVEVERARGIHERQANTNPYVVCPWVLDEVAFP